MIRPAQFDAEASDHGLGTTHVRLVRVGKLVHLLFSSRQDAVICYAETSSKFKSAESKFERDFH